MKSSQDRSEGLWRRCTDVFWGGGNYCTVSQIIARLNSLIFKDKVVSEQLLVTNKVLTSWIFFYK